MVLFKLTEAFTGLHGAELLYTMYNSVHPNNTGHCTVRALSNMPSETQMEEVCVPGKVLPLWSSAPSGGLGGATDSFLSAARLARGGWRESSGPGSPAPPPRPQHSSPAGQEENYTPSPPTTGQRDTDRPYHLCFC
ncbi:unnamed protein product [Gadus morhua 'NCC']